MSALRKINPKYAAVKIIRVDWDQFSKSKIVEQLKIPRRSTLVMFNKGKEVARVVAETRKDQLEKLFKAVT